jgi:hypothetical protein
MVQSYCSTHGIIDKMQSPGNLYYSEQVDMSALISYLLGQIFEIAKQS